MDDDFLNYNRQILFDYLFSLIEKCGNKGFYESYFDKLMETEELIQKYIYQIEEFEDDENNENNYTFTKEINLEGDDYYNNLIEKIRSLYNKVISVTAQSDVEYLVQSIFLAEITINYDIEESINFYKNIINLIYLEYDKICLSRRLLDLHFLYLEDNIDKISKTPRIKDELLMTHNLLQMSKNYDVFDVYFLMETGAVYDMIGDVNNTISLLENAQYELNSILKNVYHSLNFIYSEIIPNSIKNERIIKMLKKSGIYISDPIIELAIERADGFFYKKNFELNPEIEKNLSPDFFHPLKIYLCITAGDSYFEKKNYKTAEYYYTECIETVIFYFEYIYYKLGYLYEQKGNFEKAYENYEWIYNEEELESIKKAFAEGKKWQDADDV
ncbi:hypothetical protein KA977_15305 [Candidatus Dependentiae bacterium]|nr:hypothetical protein [Candidatus Dependentiae bacterium]